MDKVETSVDDCGHADGAVGIFEVERGVYIVGMDLVMQGRCHSDRWATRCGKAILSIGLDDGSKELAYFGGVIGCEEASNGE